MGKISRTRNPGFKDERFIEKLFSTSHSYMAFYCDDIHADTFQWLDPPGAWGDSFFGNLALAIIFPAIADDHTDVNEGIHKNSHGDLSAYPYIEFEVQLCRLKLHSEMFLIFMQGCMGCRITPDVLEVGE